MSWQQRLYSGAPWAVRELLVAFEARRRNRYRRYGRYAAVRREFAFDHYRLATPDSLAQDQLDRVRALLAQARKQSSYYQSQLPANLRDLDELTRIPLLRKQDIRSHARDIAAPDLDPHGVWQ